MKFATEVKTYNFCIPHDADANQTFTFQYEYLVHKTSGGTRYVYVENETRINELNETLRELNKTKTNYKLLYEYYYKLFNNLVKKYNKLLEEKNALEQQQTCISTNMTPHNVSAYESIEEKEILKDMLKFLILTGLIVIFLIILRDTILR